MTRTAEPQPSRPPRILYQTSTLGDGLLAALWPLAEWGVPHDKDLYRIVADRAGWLEDER